LVPLRAEWASIRFLIAGRSGCLAGVSGVDEARRVPSVREVSIGKRLGAAVRPAEEAADRIGFIIASGPSRAQVLLDVEEAVRRVRLDIG
ncbi:MAG TPA: hypothetical protein VLE27_13795, partial [Thermoanaerobaculia bacterium]|nr:hypothetical protein [Thermoanaerobaculia bacterium]